MSHCSCNFVNHWFLKMSQSSEVELNVHLLSVALGIAKAHNQELQAVGFIVCRRMVNVDDVAS